MAVSIQPVPRGQYGEPVRRFLDILRTRITDLSVSGGLDHTLLANIGTNTHAVIDAHIADGTKHFTMLDEDDLVSDSATQAATQQSIKAYVDANGGVTDHTLLSNIGTNTHTAIDTHIADTTIHYTMLDEDNMASDSATDAATQQSIKAYVTSSVSAIDFWDRTGTTLTTNTAGDNVTVDGTMTTTEKRIISTETVTSSATMGDVETTVCNSATAITLTLPAITADRKITVKNIGAGTVTLDGNGVETIGGDLTFDLYTDETLELVGNGTDWI